MNLNVVEIVVLVTKFFLIPVLIINGRLFGYTKITSEFGYRKAPTAGSSTYHSGIDIAAPTGSNLVSCINGIVTFTGFKGAGGHTIIISNSNVEIAYCHVDSKYYPQVGDYVVKGEVIGKVGPKYISDVDNNPYKDKNGKATNGATTRTTSTF